MKKGLTLERMKRTITLPAWKDLGFPDMLPYASGAVHHEMNKE
jgi:hypothetical protein